MRQGDKRQISVHIKNFIRPQREKEMLFPLQNLTSSPRYPPLPGCSTALTLPPCSPSLVTLSTLPIFPDSCMYLFIFQINYLLSSIHE